MLSVQFFFLSTAANVSVSSQVSTLHSTVSTNHQDPEMRAAATSSRQPAIVLLLLAALVLTALLIFIQSSFTSSKSQQRPSSAPDKFPVLSDFQYKVQQCVGKRGLGLSATIIDHCKLVLKFPEGTNSTWFHPELKVYEPLEYTFDACDVLMLWEQYRNMTTVLTREYLDVRPDGWLNHAAKRIARLGADKCYNRSLCEEILRMVLPSKPPFYPHQFHTCAVVGNSGDLLKTEFGKEIDEHAAVFRENDAPVNQTYAKHVGLKRNFRLVVKGSPRNVFGTVNGSSDEVLIIKHQMQRDYNPVIEEIPNPVYLFQGIDIYAKGTGSKSIEMALSVCDVVDIYGFTVDPGYTEWTRYFTEPRGGHNPLQGRAYYQLLECLGVIRIHSPMRATRKDDWSDIPRRDIINRACASATRFKQNRNGKVGDSGPFRRCKVWGKAGDGPLSGAPDMSETRKKSQYSKWEKMPFKELRKETQDHYFEMNGVSLYKKRDGHSLADLVCVRHPLPSREMERQEDSLHNTG